MAACALSPFRESQRPMRLPAPQFSGVGTWLTEQGCQTQAIPWQQPLQALPLIAHPTRGRLRVRVLTWRPRTGRGRCKAGALKLESAWTSPGGLLPTGHWVPPPEALTHEVCGRARESAFLANSNCRSRHFKDEGEKAWLHQRVLRREESTPISGSRNSAFVILVPPPPPHSGRDT